ncbi:MAG: hypothetical protein GX802_04095 [Clostridiales bacterium]|nr:hypothetical protein [Clostridiales bacterium]
MHCKRCGQRSIKNSEYCLDCAGLQCKICGQMPAKNSEYCLNCLLKRSRFADVEIIGLIFGVLSLITWKWPIIGLPISIYGLFQSMSGKLNERRFAQTALTMCYVGTCANVVCMLVWGMGGYI